VNLKTTFSLLFALTLLVAFSTVNPNLKQSTVASITLSDASVNDLNNNIHQGENSYHPIHRIEKPTFKTDELLKISKQLSIVRLTMRELEQQNTDNKIIDDIKFTNETEEHVDLNDSRLLHARQELNSFLHSDIDQMHVVLPVYQTVYISKQIKTKEHAFGELKQNMFIHKNSISKRSTKSTKNDFIATNHIGYWQTVHSIESKQGKLLYRPKNKSRNCNNTSGPCGHHQLTVQALKDIGCDSLQCRKDRLDYQKSLKLSKKLLALNEKRLKKNGISKLKGYQKYLIHQQGAYGIKNIIAATQGKKTLSTKIKKNMANNSPYSYRQLKNMGSKAAADKFMNHWKTKWVNEKRLIVATQSTSATDNLIKTNFIPIFNDSEIQLALNMRF